MENASKALIIAGAILLSILIISLGIMVYNNAKNTVGNANLSTQEIQTFNSQWESYAGGNRSASEVRTLISAVIASNAAEARTGSARMVGWGADYSSAAPSSATLENYYNSTSTYKITPHYAATGLVDYITVSPD